MIWRGGAVLEDDWVSKLEELGLWRRGFFLRLDLETRSSWGERIAEEHSPTEGY